MHPILKIPNSIFPLPFWGTVSDILKGVNTYFHIAHACQWDLFFATGENDKGKSFSQRYYRFVSNFMEKIKKIKEITNKQIKKTKEKKKRKKERNKIKRKVENELQKKK